MHRFMILKKLPVSQGNFTVPFREAYYPRTCTLCNRIVSTPLAGFSRIHSTLAYPEKSSRHAGRKKKSKSSKNLAATRIDSAVNSKFRRKMKITVLESTTAGELPPSSFITSSPSSPVFAEQRLPGVTIMLPTNSSRSLEDTLSHLHKLSSTKTLLENGQEPPNLSQVAALMLSGLSRNRYLLNDFNSQHGKTDSQASSSMLQEESRIAEEDIEKYAISTAKKDKKRNPDELNISRAKKVYNRTSYIDIFVNAGNIKLAFKHAMLGIKYFPGFVGRNVLLEPLCIHAANEGDAACLVELVNLANRYHLPLTLLSYKTCLELMGRLPKTPFNIDVIKVVLKSMEDSNVKLEDVIMKCQNRPILIKKIFEAINCVDPQKAACHAVTSLAYNVDVLAPLNDSSQGKAIRFYSPAGGLMVHENAEKLVDEQIAIHDSAVFQIKNIACTMSSSEIENLLQKQQALVDEWKVSIEAGIRNGLKAIKRDITSSHCLGNYLECLPISVYVNLIIQEVHSRLDDSDKQSVGFIQAQRGLGKRAKVFYDHEVLSRLGIGKKARNAHVEYCKRYSSPELYPEGPSNPREIWESVVSELDYDDTHASQVLRKWSLEIYTRIGKFLYEILLKDVKIDENIGTDREGHSMVPALYVVYRKTTKGYQKQLKVHPAVHHIFPTRMQPYIAMDPFELPMVCPPRPWVSATDGVYPLVAPRLQRIPDSLTGDLALQENLESVNTQELYPSLDSLNQLGAVPWRVNNPVFDVVVEVFNSGGMKQLAIPSPPSASKQPPAIPPDASIVDKSLMSKGRAIIRQENAAEYSLWCDTLYKLCIANEFRDRVFWLPHNMDFRGRVYPICPHLQHMSGDMARSLLIFAKGEKLGPDGLDWLKIHTMNLVGNMSKDSISARLAHANEILPKILDSAENPLTGEKWWMDSEYPWQTLAACMEINNAIASGDPENFISHFPVHQDGSCNGLQHYAALGRDSLGAQSVNLVDTEKPSDVYSCVATLVEQQRAKDAAEGNTLAQSLEGFIARKVVKPTVMTTVYGVTSYGAQMQIEGQLKDLNYSHDHVRKAANYLMKLVFQSLGEMFTSSRNTQDWLTMCADKIVKGKGMSVTWVTPLGLPVIQPYFKQKKKQFSKKTQKSTSNENGIRAACKYGEPSSQKQRNAFSPNFIHSLDSCHMILTGLYCEQAGITYVSVHDCFWVHACNVQDMSKICREQFVNLHSKPILQELSDYLQKTYISDNRMVAADKAVVAVENRRLKRLFCSVPPKGNFDLSEVLKSKYFFS